MKKTEWKKEKKSHADEVATLFGFIFLEGAMPGHTQRISSQTTGKKLQTNANDLKISNLRRKTSLAESGSVKVSSAAGTAMADWRKPIW